MYNKNELVLPYVNPLKKLRIKKKGMLSQFCTTICSCFTKKEDNVAKDNKMKEYDLKITKENIREIDETMKVVDDRIKEKKIKWQNI